MPDFDRLKNMIVSEARALEARAQEANNLRTTLKEDGWSEGIIDIAETYYSDVHKCHSHLSDLYTQVTQREEKERAERQNPASILTQIAVRLEEAGGHFAATVGGITASMGALRDSMGAVQDSVGALEETAQHYQGVASYVREAVSALQPAEPTGHVPDEPAPQPDPTPSDSTPSDSTQDNSTQAEEPPEEPGQWSKS